MKILLTRGLFFCALMAIVTVITLAQPRSACAGATDGGGACGGMQAFRDALKQRESSGREYICNDAVSGAFDGRSSGPRGRDCCGYYQICGAERASLGFGDRDRYLRDPAYQEAAYTAYQARSIQEMRNSGAWSYIGQTVGGVQITDTALIGAAHIAGAPRVARWLACGGCASENRCDSEGTCLSTYLGRFAQYGGTDGSTDCTGAASGGGESRFVQLCDPEIEAAVSAQVNASVARLNEIVNTQYTPPAPLSQIANNPCSSKELNRITRQFSYAPSRYINQAKNNVLSAAGPVGGILQNLFKSEIASINQAAANLPKMLNFQSMASEALGSLMSSLGIGGDAFSSEMCGLMVDMVLKYVQCENPIKLPNLGNFTGSLNDLLPNGCAGAALRSGLYQLGNSQALKSLNQPVGAGGAASGVSLPR